MTYALGIYLLNLFIAFLTPKIDPAVMDDSDGELCLVWELPFFLVLFIMDSDVALSSPRLHVNMLEICQIKGGFWQPEEKWVHVDGQNQDFRENW